MSTFGRNNFDHRGKGILLHCTVIGSFITIRTVIFSVCTKSARWLRTGLQLKHKLLGQILVTIVRLNVCNYVGVNSLLLLNRRSSFSLFSPSWDLRILVPYLYTHTTGNVGLSNSHQPVMRLLLDEKTTGNNSFNCHNCHIELWSRNLSST